MKPSEQNRWSAAVLAVVLSGNVFAAEWQTGDLVVGRNDPVTLTEAGKSNTSLTLHGNYTVHLSSQGAYSVMDASAADAAKISIGPNSGDDATFSLRYANLNTPGGIGAASTRADVIVGENGGNGRFFVGSDTAWRQSASAIRNFTLSENAVTSAETFDALAIGYAGSLVVDKIVNRNAKPLRVRFRNITTSQADYPAALRSYWKNYDGIFDMANGDIIVEGTRAGDNSEPIIIQHWGFDDNKCSIVNGTPKGKLYFEGICDLYFNAFLTSSASTWATFHFGANAANIVWNHSRNTIFTSTQGLFNDVPRAAVHIEIDGDNVLPCGPQTKYVVIRSPADLSKLRSRLDLKGHSQKLNGLILENGSEVANEGGTATLTFGEGDTDGIFSGSISAASVACAKTGTGTLIMSNAMVSALSALGGTVRFAPGTANHVGVFAVTNAFIDLPSTATLTVDKWEGAVFLPSDNASNVIQPADFNTFAGLPLVKDGDGLLTCMTPADANGMGVHVRGGTLRMGGCSCANRYWRFVAKKCAAANGKYVIQRQALGFRFEMTLGLGHVGLFAENGFYCMGSMTDAAVGTAANALAEGEVTVGKPFAYWTNALFQELYSTSETDPVLLGGGSLAPHYIIHENDSDLGYNCYDYGRDSSSSRIRDNGCGLLFTNAVLSVDDPTTWETVTWRLKSGARNPASYNLSRLVNNNDKACAHPTDWALQSSPTGADGTWETMDERSGETWGTKDECGYHPQYAFTYNEHVPYLFSSKNANWKFDTFGTVEVDAGATLDLCELRTANIAINALRVDCTKGAGTIRKFVPAANGRIDLAIEGEFPGKIDLPLVLDGAENTDRLETWTVYVNGAPLDKGRVRMRNGRLRVSVEQGLLLIFR